MKIADKRLLLKYALPCVQTLVKRGSVKKEFAKKLMDAVAKNKKIPRNAEHIFGTAIENCTRIAKRMKKRHIDADVIRRYFLVEHERVVNKRFKEKRDFDPIRCKTYTGRISKMGKLLEVETILGRMKYRKDFVSGLEVGDTVIVHNDFIVEKTNHDIEGLIK